MEIELESYQNPHRDSKKLLRKHMLFQGILSNTMISKGNPWEEIQRLGQ